MLAVKKMFLFPSQKAELLMAELRLGNRLIEKSTDKVVKVSGITVDGILYEGGDTFFPIENFVPIELDEYHLEKKLKFKKIDRKGSYGNIYVKSIIDYNFCIERDYNDYLSYFVGIEYTDSPLEGDTNKIHYFSFKMKYVHQLQNLFFDVEHFELPF